MIELLYQTVTSIAETDPDRVAFRCKGSLLTYGELETQSNRFARLLLDNGTEKGDRIGVFMPRCVESVVAIYGVFKAGCIFVALDPNQSAGSLQRLVQNCGVRQLVSHASRKQVISQLLKSSGSRLISHVIGIDPDEEWSREKTDVHFAAWQDLNSFDGQTPGVKVTTEDPAYIMYSSGSTGQPKGITHTHRSGLSYSRASIHTYQVTKDDVIANHSPINFDMSTFGYFTSCLAGATTVIVPKAHTKFPRSLTSFVAAEKITIWYSVPLALIQMLLRGGIEEQDFSNLRWIKFGGEPFPSKYLRALMNLVPDCRFSNVYGPAEVNQCSFYHVPSSFASDTSDAPVPIGRVWQASLGRVIDQNDRLVEKGEVGQLVVHSSTMMHGYWGQPEKTRDSLWFERSADGQELTYYRTGDLVREHENGELSFVGRQDRQVKVRGYRVELDEVENAIGSLDAVEEVGVFCVSRDHSKEIRAAVILRAQFDLDEEAIKKELGNCLSWYSIPAEIRIVSRLPRTSSGKIDRNQLRLQDEGTLVS